jgi:hypothetical protein
MDVMWHLHGWWHGICLAPTWMLTWHLRGRWRGTQSNNDMAPKQTMTWLPHGRRRGYWHGNDDVTTCPIQNGPKLGQLFQWHTFFFNSFSNIIKIQPNKVFQFLAHLPQYITTNDINNFCKLQPIKFNFQPRLHACFHLSSQHIHNGTFTITTTLDRTHRSMAHTYFHTATKATMAKAPIRVYLSILLHLLLVRYPFMIWLRQL